MRGLTPSAIIVVSLFITSTVLAEDDVYFVNQDCFVAKNIDIFKEMMDAAKNRDFRKIKRMQDQGKIFLPDIGLEVRVAKRHNRIVYCVPLDYSVSFWTMDNILTNTYGYSGFK